LPLIAGHAAEAAIDGLPLEASAGGMNVGNDVAPELDSVGTLPKSSNGVESGVSTAGAAAGERGR
jgi:hypothetical protein